MVLKKAAVLRGAALLGLLPVIAWAHQAPAPLRPMHGGVVKEVARTRVELVRRSGELLLFFRNQQNAPVLPAVSSIQLWGREGIEAVPYETSGHQVRVADPGDSAELRTIVRFTDAAHTPRLLSFPPSTKGDLQ